jgi:hypothetical protein
MLSLDVDAMIEAYRPEIARRRASLVGLEGPDDGGKTRVRVHQLVKSLQGNILSDSEALHVFTMNSGLISAMNLGDEADPTAGPSAAFVHRS